VQNRKRNVIINTLKERGYMTFAEHKDTKTANESNDTSEASHDTSTDKEGFSYLLNMSIWHLTWEKVCGKRFALGDVIIIPTQFILIHSNM
jgi:hypothetical protein